MTHLWRTLATLGPIGYAPVAPATAASAVVAGIGWVLPVPPLGTALIWLAAGTALAIWVSDQAEKTLGHDAKPIVADEVVGQSIALLWVPHTALSFVAAFVLFRLFDIWKPLGAREIQRLPGGLGVVADDVVAGVIACAVYHGVRWAARNAGWSV